MSHASHHHSTRSRFHQEHQSELTNPSKLCFAQPITRGARTFKRLAVGSYLPSSVVFRLGVIWIEPDRNRAMLYPMCKGRIHDLRPCMYGCLWWGLNQYCG